MRASPARAAVGADNASTTPSGPAAGQKRGTTSDETPLSIHRDGSAAHHAGWAADAWHRTLDWFARYLTTGAAEAL